MSIAASLPASSRLVQYYQLTKPRVVQLIVFCALVGMVLAVPGLPSGNGLLASGWSRVRQLRLIAWWKKPLMPR